jgi:hypothetical protein
MVRLAEIAHAEGATWASDIHGRMITLRTPLPRALPRTLSSARTIAAGLCDELAHIEPLAEMILAQATRTWVELLARPVEESHGSPGGPRALARVTLAGMLGTLVRRRSGVRSGAGRPGHHRRG